MKNPVFELNIQFVNSAAKFLQRADLKPSEIQEYSTVMETLGSLFEAFKESPVDAIKKPPKE